MVYLSRGCSWATWKFDLWPSWTLRPKSNAARCLNSLRDAFASAQRQACSQDKKQRRYLLPEWNSNPRKLGVLPQLSRYTPASAMGTISSKAWNAKSIAFSPADSRMVETTQKLCLRSPRNGETILDEPALQVLRSKLLMKSQTWNPKLRARFCMSDCKGGQSPVTPASPAGPWSDLWRKGRQEASRTQDLPLYWFGGVLQRKLVQPSFWEQGSLREQSATARSNLLQLSRTSRTSPIIRTIAIPLAKFCIWQNFPVGLPSVWLLYWHSFHDRAKSVDQAIVDSLISESACESCSCDLTADEGLSSMWCQPLDEASFEEVSNRIFRRKMAPQTASILQDVTMPVQGPLPDWASLYIYSFKLLQMRLMGEGSCVGRLFTLASAVLAMPLTPASADLGLLSWGALTPQNRTAAGRTLYGGDVRSATSKIKAVDKLLPTLDFTEPPAYGRARSASLSHSTSISRCDVVLWRLYFEKIASRRHDMVLYTTHGSFPFILTGKIGCWWTVLYSLVLTWYSCRALTMVSKEIKTLLEHAAMDLPNPIR